MGSGLSAFEAARTWTTQDGEKPLERSGLSLETIESWTTNDVNKAIEATNKSAAPLLSVHIEKFGVTGAMILSMSESDVDEFCQRLKLDEALYQWVTRTVIRLQKRNVIVGRDKRFAPLPEGWTEFMSRTRPGEISYRNEHTGACTKVRPKKPASSYVEPLPVGWLQMPSSRYPGKNIYMHTHKPNMHIAWRPLPLHQNLLDHPDHAYEVTKGLRRAIELVGSSDPNSTLASHPEQLLKPYVVSRKAQLRSSAFAAGKLIIAGQGGYRRKKKLAQAAASDDH